MQHWQNSFHTIYLYSLCKLYFRLKPSYMNQLVAINLITIFLLNLFYLIAKIGQYRAFSDYTVGVNEVSTQGYRSVQLVGAMW